MYKEEFQEALSRNAKFGLEVPEIAYSDDMILTNEMMDKFVKQFQVIANGMSQEDVVAQCLNVNFQLSEVIGDIIGSQAIFTLGYVETATQNMFHQDDASLKAMLEKGIKTDHVGLHAWLTLPSMEIIDLTLSTSFSIANGLKKGEGGIIASHPDHLKQGLKFHPMLVGAEFLWKIGAFRFATS